MSLIGRSSEVERLQEQLRCHDVVVVHGAVGVGTTALVREALASLQPAWIDLGGIDDARAIADETARVLASDVPTAEPHASIGQLIATANAPVVWDHASSMVLDLVATVRGVAPGRLVVITHAPPPGHLAAVEVLPLGDAAMRDLVRELDVQGRQPLHDEIARIARGNPRIAELVLQLAYRQLRVIASEVTSRLVQDGDVRRAIAFLRDTRARRASSVPIAAIEAFVRDGDLVRATSELARSTSASAAPGLIQVAAAALPALRGDTERSRHLLRELVVPVEHEGDRCAAVLLSYLCEERYIRAIAAARRARRAYVASDARRFGLLVDVAEVIALLECDRVDDARARARHAVSDLPSGGPLEPLGRDVSALFQAALHGRRGDLTTYLRLVEPVMASLEVRGDRAPQAIASRYVARACLGLGRFADAERYLRSAAAIGAQPGMSALLSFIDRDRASLDVARGDVDAARDRLATALERTPANPYLLIDAWAVSDDPDAALPAACTVYDATRAYAALRGAERRLRIGDHEGAARDAAVAERWYEAAGLWYELARARAANAEALLHLGEHDRCREAIERCLAIAVRHRYRSVAVSASLVAAALADRIGDLDAYALALIRARDEAGPLVDDALARACGRLDLDAAASPDTARPFAALVERLGLARAATHEVTIGQRVFLTDGDERLAVAADLVVDVADAALVTPSARRSCPDMPLRLLERLAAAGSVGVTLEALYLDVWQGRSYMPLRHRNAIYVALQRTRSLLQTLHDGDVIERISDAAYRLVPSLTIAIRRRRGETAALAHCG